MSLHGELRAVLFGEETKVVFDFLKREKTKFLNKMIEVYTLIL